MSLKPMALATSDFWRVRRLCDSATSHALHVSSAMKTIVGDENVRDRRAHSQGSSLLSQALDSKTGTTGKGVVSLL